MKLVAEAGRDGDLVAALGAAAVQNSSTGLGGHANEKAVDLATAAAVGLEGALGHGENPVLSKWSAKGRSAEACGPEVQLPVWPSITVISEVVQRRCSAQMFRAVHRMCLLNRSAGRSCPDQGDAQTA
jgi:hypothetical protein